MESELSQLSIRDEIKEEETEEEEPIVSHVTESMKFVDEEIDSLRATGRQRVRTRHGKKKLSRENLVKSVLSLFDKLSVRELVGELAISFDGEEAQS